VHDIGSIPTVLERVLRDSLYLLPYEVKMENSNPFALGAMTVRMFLL
jgi:hypothetical protein